MRRRPKPPKALRRRWSWGWLLDWTEPRYSFSDFLFFEAISEVVGDLIEGVVVVVAEIIGGVW